MTQPNIPLAPKTITRLAVWQTILTGLQSVAGAAVLADFLGARYAAILVILISGAQQTVNGLLSKSVAAQQIHVENALSRVDTAIEHAETAAAQSEQAAATARKAVSDSRKKVP